jgi:hypothetical protein
MLFTGAMTWESVPLRSTNIHFHSVLLYCTLLSTSDFFTECSPMLPDIVPPTTSLCCVLLSMQSCEHWSSMPRCKRSCRAAGRDSNLTHCSGVVYLSIDKPAYSILLHCLCALRGWYLTVLNGRVVYAPERSVG